MNKSSLIGLLLLSLLGWLVFGSLFCKTRLCGLGASAAAVPAAVSSCGTWSFNDGNTFKETSDRYYRFKKSSSNLIVPQNKSLINAINNTVKHLKNNSGRKLVITGYYDNDEKNNTTDTNLGMARAKSVKNALMKMGVPANQMDVSADQMSSRSFEGDTVCKGVDFSFTKMSGATGAVGAAAATSRIASIKNTLTAKPVTVYFGTNQSEINLTAQQRKEIQDMKYYLDQVEGSSVEVSGHTDNTGDASSNKRLSKKRAEFVRDYLTRTFNFKANNLQVAGYGSDKPVQDNNSSAGRKANRRVEIIINK